MSLVLETLRGADMADRLEDVARLRIAVFRDFPYLYAGDPANETRYLSGYADHPDACLVVARDGSAVVGAATGMPLGAHGDAAHLRLPATAPPREAIYYCAESVLLPAYRGRGLGHAFFERREAVARQAGFEWAGFLAVQRPPDHPLRPPDYRPLDGFWKKRGYAPVDGAAAAFAWKDVGDEAETEKPLRFWLRALSSVTPAP